MGVGEFVNQGKDLPTATEGQLASIHHSGTPPELAAQPGQFRHHDPCCVVLAEADLGKAMELTPTLNDIHRSS